MKIVVIFTCFNRKEKTINCINSLVKGNQEHELSFIVVDDNSNDGTREELENLELNIEIITGNGQLYWAGGMRIGIERYLQKEQKSDYVLFVNDDVIFYSGIISKMIEKSLKNNDALLVGATCDEKYNFSYGAIKFHFPPLRELYYQVHPSKEIIECDTFNCNCVLIKNQSLIAIGNFDGKYRHTLADFDYGLKVKRLGYKILSSDDYVGICNKNSNKGTWKDTSLSRFQRIKKKEMVKGAPIKEWFYFMNKNFGIIYALRYSISPYFRIILKK